MRVAGLPLAARCWAAAVHLLEEAFLAQAAGRVAAGDQRAGADVFQQGLEARVLLDRQGLLDGGQAGFVGFFEQHINRCAALCHIA